MPHLPAVCGTFLGRSAFQFINPHKAMAIVSLCRSVLIFSGVLGEVKKFFPECLCQQHFFFKVSVIMEKSRLIGRYKLFQKKHMAIK